MREDECSPYMLPIVDVDADAVGGLSIIGAGGPRGSCGGGGLGLPLLVGK
ncbi:hypothetical protein Sjap_018513 [Stephania japonica]|uniref:Uncharacterized protein n=1 Tax=Stephania japonica TaxID=461633 RepID=A0AAP0NKL2_9MAGN